MKTIKVQGKITRSGDFNIRSAVETDTGIEVNSPSLLINLLGFQRRLRQKQVGRGFEYTFPFTINRSLETNGFKITFPLIFE